MSDFFPGASVPEVSAFTRASDPSELHQHAHNPACNNAHAREDREIKIQQTPDGPALILGAKSGIFVVGIPNRHGCTTEFIAAIEAVLGHCEYRFENCDGTALLYAGNVPEHLPRIEPLILPGDGQTFLIGPSFGGCPLQDIDGAEYGDLPWVDAIPDKLTRLREAVTDVALKHGVHVGFSLLSGPVAANGFSPIPIQPNRKAPGYLAPAGVLVPLSGWQRYCEGVAPQWEFEIWNERDASVGLCCGYNDFIAVDIDTLDEATSAAIAKIMDELLPATIERIGRAPKFTRLYRIDGGIKSQSTPKWTVNGKENGIEILSTGRQCVAFGIHPDTQKCFTWRGGSPLTVKATDLPPITRSQLEELYRRVNLLLPDGAKRIALDGAHERAAHATSDSTDPITPEVWDAYLAALPNDAAVDYNT